MVVQLRSRGPELSDAHESIDCTAPQLRHSREFISRIEHLSSRVADYTRHPIRW